MALHQVRELDTDELAELLLAAQTRMEMWVSFRDEASNNESAVNFANDHIRPLSAAITALHSTHVKQPVLN